LGIGCGGRAEEGEVGHVDDADDAVGGVGEELAAVAGEAEEGEEACAEFGGVNCAQGGGFDDVDVALGCAGYDVCAVGGEDGGCGGLFGFGGGEGCVAVGKRGAGEAVSCGDGGGDVDEEWGGFEQGDDEEGVIVWVKFGGVDGRFEFGGADSGLCGQIPEAGTAVLRGRQEVAATARPAGVDVSGKGALRRWSRDSLIDDVEPAVNCDPSIPETLYLFPVPS
jgi:hypothetical protein